VRTHERIIGEPRQQASDEISTKGGVLPHGEGAAALSDCLLKNVLVILTGAADSWFANRKATEIACEGGANQVFINITVR